MTRIKKIIAGIIALTMIIALLPQSPIKAAGKTVTVKTQKELNAALKDPSITQINIETKKKVTLAGDTRGQRNVKGKLLCSDYTFIAEGDSNGNDWSNVYLTFANGDGLAAISSVNLVRNPKLTLSGITVDQAKQWTGSGSGTVMIGETSYTITDGVWPD